MTMSSRTDDSVFASLQQVTGATYDNAEYNRDLIDIYMLRKARQKGVRLPTGGPPDEYKYLGAHVEQSTAGTNRNVVYIDVSSMYPSLLLTLNASPETIIGTRSDLRESQYTEDDCVWGYIDTREVKHLTGDEPWQQYTNGQYKIVYDPDAPDIKWTCDNPEHESGRTGDGPRYEKCYFLSHDVQKGFLTECVEELIALKNQYRGTSLYGSTKRVTNCFGDDMEVVRAFDRKSVDITSVGVGDYLRTVNPETGELGQTRVERTYSYETDEPLLHIRNHQFDLKLTADHFLPVRPVDGEDGWDEYRELPAGLLDDETAWEVPHTNATFTGADVSLIHDTERVHCVELADSTQAMFVGKNKKYQPNYNSIYGVLGFANEESSFRLFDWRIAEAITLTGRKMIQFSRDYVVERLAEMGYNAYPALGDTDGVGIAVPDAASRHEALTAVEKAVEQLNTDGYDDFFERECAVGPQRHHGEIEVESFAPKVFIPSRTPPHGEVGVKKRRIEWQTWNDKNGECDEISITGLEAERSDVAPITKQAQRAFASQLRHSDSTARENLFPTLREYADAIADGQMDVQRVCKRGGIGQPLSEYGTTERTPAPLYRGAKYANEQLDGVTIQQGDKPMVVYVADVGGSLPETYTAVTNEDGDEVDAIAVTDASRLPTSVRVDWDRHLQKTLIEPLKPLLETRFGDQVWSEIRHQHRQQQLGEL